MLLVSLQLGESARLESSQEHSEDGGKIIRTGDVDGQKGLSSGMWPFCFAQVMLVSDKGHGYYMQKMEFFYPSAKLIQTTLPWSLVDVV